MLHSLVALRHMDNGLSHATLSALFHTAGTRDFK